MFEARILVYLNLRARNCGGPWVLACRVRKIDEEFDGDPQRVRGHVILDRETLQEFGSKILSTRITRY